MRCPTCHALNSDSADWCSQCYSPLRTAAQPPEPEPEAVGPEASAPETTVDAAPGEPSSRPPHGPAVAGPHPATADASPERSDAGGSFRQTEDGLDWRCQVCQEWNPIEVTSCRVCGAAFGLGHSDPGEEIKDVPEATVMVAGAAAPGLGHILLGRTAAGVARLATWLLWLIGGLWLLVEARSADGSILPAVPMLLGALVLWFTSPVDAMTLRRGGEQELLTPRVFLWLVVGVLGALLLAFLAATMSLPEAVG